ncbi:MAG: BMP family lipoprotein, partial [Fusobacteriaceae bacterium]
MKKLLSSLVVLSSLLLTACGGTKEAEKPAEVKTTETKTAPAKSPLKVGIVLSTGGLGDKSFNDSAYRGLEMAKKDLGVDFKHVEPASSAED